MDMRLEIIPPRLDALLRLMHARERAWVPRIGYPRCSAGFANGGAYTGDWDDFESECDAYAASIMAAAWASLNQAERLSVEVVMGWMPAVVTVRVGVLEGAVAKLIAKCQAQGVL